MNRTHVISFKSILLITILVLSSSLISFPAFFSLGIGAPHVNADTQSTIWTDQADYAPESIVTIYGSGFNPDASIAITVTNPDNSITSLSATSNDTGMFSVSYQIDSLDGTYYVMATDGTNTAYTSFTDPASIGTTTVLTNPANGATLNAGSSYTWSGTITPDTGSVPSGDTVQLYYTTDGSCPTNGVGTGTLVATTTTSGGVGFSPFSDSFTAPAAGTTYKFFARFPQAPNAPDGPNLAVSNSVCNSVTINVAVTTYKLNVNVTPSLLQGSAQFSISTSSGSCTPAVGTYTYNQTFTCDAGTLVTLTDLATSSAITASNGYQYFFWCWSVDTVQQGTCSGSSLGTNPITITMNAKHTAIASYVTPQTLTFGFSGPSTLTKGTTGTFDASYTITAGMDFTNVKVQGGITAKATSIIVYCDGNLVLTESSLGSGSFSACGGTLTITISHQNNVFTWALSTMSKGDSHTLNIVYNFTPTSAGTFYITGTWSAVCTSIFGTLKTPYTGQGSVVAS